MRFSARSPPGKPATRAAAASGEREVTPLSERLLRSPNALINSGDGSVRPASDTAPGNPASAAAASGESSATSSRERNFVANVASRFAKSGVTVVRPPSPRPLPLNAASAASFSSGSVVSPRSNSRPRYPATSSRASFESVAPSRSSLGPLNPASTAAVSGVRFFTFGSRPFHITPSSVNARACSGETVERPSSDRPGPR